MTRERSTFSLLASLSAAGLMACAPTAAEGATQTRSGPATAEVQEPHSPSAATGQSAAPLRFAKSQHDFGRVFDIDDLVCSFAFQNVGDETVVIDEVKASCGCTTPTLARTRFEPGESDELQARWEPKGLGRQSKTLTVRSTGLSGGATVLTISADITPFVLATPMAVKFDDVEIGRGATARVTLTCPDPAWLVQGVRTSHEHVEAAIVEEQAAGAKVLEVRVGPQAPWGFFTARVYVDMLGRVSPEAAPVVHAAELTVSATVVGQVRISQPMFSIGKIGPGPFQADLFLQRADGAPFEVVSAHVAPGAPPVGLVVRAEPAVEGGQFAQRLVLSGDTAGYVGYIKGSVQFSTDVPGEEPRTLRFGGNVVPE